MGGWIGGEGAIRILEIIVGKFLVQCYEKWLALVLFAGPFILLI